MNIHEFSQTITWPDTTVCGLLELFVTNCFIRWNAERYKCLCLASYETLLADVRRWICDLLSPDCYGCHVRVLSFSFSSASSSTNYSSEVMLCLRVWNCLSREETNAGCHGNKSCKKCSERLRIRTGLMIGVKVRVWPLGDSIKEKNLLWQTPEYLHNFTACFRGKIKSSGVIK